MYQDNEDDWQILKEYKKEEQIKQTKKAKEYAKVKNKALRNIKQGNKDLKTLSDKPIGPGRSAEPLRNGEINRQTQYIEDAKDDVEKATELENASAIAAKNLTAEIQKIDEKIKEIRTRKNQKLAKKSKKSKEAVQKCPKKCRVNNVVISGDGGSRPLNLGPYEGTVPEYHVVSGSTGADVKTIEVNFKGSCDFGKSQSADDSKKALIEQRAAGGDAYCPRVGISSTLTGIDISRPSLVKFAAYSNKSRTSSGTVEHKGPPSGFTFFSFLVRQLIFAAKDEQAVYDFNLVSCKGQLPYKAKIIAYPACSWSINASLGYKASKTVSSERSFLIFDKKYKSYDEVKTSGDWELEIKGAFKYDYFVDEHTTKIKLNDFMGELGGDWKLLSNLTEFMNPINGFIERAAVAEENAPAQKVEPGIDIKSSAKVFEGDVQWTKLDIAGKWARSEMSDATDKVSGAGELTFAFNPLFGITGSVDIIQFLLRTYAGEFGKYLGRVMNMSAGTFKDDGSLDESEDYIQTTLTLKLTAEAKIGGSVGFDCKNTEKTWGISESNTGINGFVGFSLAGEVGAKAQIWEIKFAASAAFKTVSEDGKGRSGIKIDYKPAMIAGERKWYGAAEFTGLAIEWALFVKVGREGEQALAKERKQISSSGGGFGGAQTKESDKPQASSAEVKIEKKSKKPAILFNKRSLYDGKSAVSASI